MTPNGDDASNEDRPAGEGDAPKEDRPAGEGDAPKEDRPAGEGDAPSDGEDSEDAASADALEAAGIDPVVPEEAEGEPFPPDSERREFLREIAAEVRGESDESKQLSAILYRVSDLYDPAEETSPEEIYLNVRHIMRIKEQGGLRR